MAFTKVSVLVPTRYRLERLQTLLDSYAQTTEDCGEASELVFRADDDDRATVDFLLGERRRMVVGPRLEGYGSMPVFFNEMMRAAAGDVLLCGNDDMVFRTDGWAEMVLAAANQFPDGLFNIGVSTHNEAHFPFSIVSRRAAERLGFLWDPRIFWGDIYLRDAMAAFGRCVMLPDVHIDHDWAGNKPDRVFMETRPAKAQVEGNAMYWAAVHAPAVSDAVEKLRGLLA